MKIEIFSREQTSGWNRIMRIFLYRAAATAFFVAGVFYWVRLVGIYDGPLWRFDLMPVAWRATAATLAVLYPVAGLGLWMAAAWGGVLWGFLAVIEGVMLFAFPALFGGDYTMLATHVAGLSCLLALVVAGRWQRRPGNG